MNSPREILEKACRGDYNSDDNDPCMHCVDLALKELSKWVRSIKNPFLNWDSEYQIFEKAREDIAKGLEE